LWISYFASVLLHLFCSFTTVLLHLFFYIGSLISVLLLNVVLGVVLLLQYDSSDGDSTDESSDEDSIDEDEY
jgi:hypothetical protein